MDDESEVGREIRANHAKLRDFLGSPNLEFACVDSFWFFLFGFFLFVKAFL